MVPSQPIHLRTVGILPIRLCLALCRVQMRAASAEHVSHPLQLLVAGANGHGDTGSTIVTPAMKADDNEALPPTLPTVLVPSDPTRTADSVAASTSQPAVVSGCFRAHERYEILGEHGRGGLGRVSR